MPFCYSTVGGSPQRIKSGPLGPTWPTPKGHSIFETLTEIFIENALQPASPSSHSYFTSVILRALPNTLILQYTGLEFRVPFLEVQFVIMELLSNRRSDVIYI